MIYCRLTLIINTNLYQIGFPTFYILSYLIMAQSIEDIGWSSTNQHWSLYYKLNEESTIYKDFTFQRLQPSHKLIVDMDLDVMSTRQVLTHCLGPYCNKTISEYWFFSKRKSLIEGCQSQCTTSPLHAPGHCMQWIVQLHGLLPRTCIISCMLASQAPHQASTGLLSLSCLLSSFGRYVEGLCDDFQVCFLLCNVLCKCHNADECALDSLSSLPRRTISSRFLVRLDHLYCLR